MDDQTLRLEDDQYDILAKAFANHGIHPAPGITPQTCPADLLKKAGLDPDAFYQLPVDAPPIKLPEGLQRHISPMGSWTVNIWTLETPAGRIVIDTGCTPRDLAAATHGTPPLAILITHDDHDHTGGLPAFPDVPVYGPASLKPGDVIPIGGFSWRIHDLRGHTASGIGFETVWRGQSLFFPGDSIFALSIGKSRQPFDITIRNIVRALESLPDDAVICPGHGPATTVGREKGHNPFLVPCFSRS